MIGCLTRFSHFHSPPRAIGRTWSTVKFSPEEQYLLTKGHHINIKFINVMKYSKRKQNFAVSAARKFHCKENTFSTKSP